jgi:hypothetical protein
VAAATAAAAGAPAARGPGAGLGGATGDGGAEDGKLDGGFFAGTLRAGDFLLAVDDDFFELRFAVVTDVFVDGHVVFLLQRYRRKSSSVISAGHRVLFRKSKRSCLGIVTRQRGLEG